MKFMRILMLFLFFAAVLGCENQVRQTQDNPVTQGDMVIAQQVLQQIQSIEIESMWQELLEVCSTYEFEGRNLSRYIENSEKDRLRNPNCFLKAGEICNSDASMNNQQSLIQRRIQYIQETACLLWQPYDSQIWPKIQDYAEACSKEHRFHQAWRTYYDKVGLNFEDICKARQNP